MVLTLVQAIGKDKVHPRTGHEDLEGEYMYSSTLSLTSALDGRWVVNATPRLRYPREREPGNPYIGGRVAPGTVWMGAVNLAPTGIRSPGPSIP